VLPLLLEGLRAMAVDQRGFGDSHRPESGYSIPDMAADVIAMLDALEIRRATLVGRLAVSSHGKRQSRNRSGSTIWS